MADLPNHVAELMSATHPDETRWSGARAREDALLAARDYDALIEFYRVLPQRWKTEGVWSRFTPLTSTYAGTYLSLRQAMTLDAARFALGRLWASNAVDRWTYQASLTVLCHAASEAVHSAGKHFAQPIQPSKPGAPNYEFVRRRSLRDRSVSVDGKAIEAANRIGESVHLGGEHCADTVDALAVNSDDLEARDVSVVYADPPYTAQQYSRSTTS